MSDFFGRTLAQLESQVKKLSMNLSNAESMYRSDNMEVAYNVSLRLADSAERVALLARALPAYTGRPHAAQAVETIMARVIPVELGFTAEGWFCMRIPLLLPKKEAGSASYVRAFLYPAMRDFFSGKSPVRYDDCVLIYRHVYLKSRPERQRRDHDNIEVNMVTDIIALYVMDDDGPASCRHYYCSAAGPEERTEVYVVPFIDFAAWLASEQQMPDIGVILYADRPS